MSSDASNDVSGEVWGTKARYTEVLSFLTPSEYEGIPIYRVMNREGEVMHADHDPNLDDAELLKMYRAMTRYIGNRPFLLTWRHIFNHD